MKKLVAAGVLSLAAVAGTVGPLSASPLTALTSAFLPAKQERAGDRDVVLAQAMGVPSRRVDTVEAFADALKAGLAENGPFLIEARIGR